MLRKLEVQNFALIEQASLNFEKGFHAITGETGSGKSILLGALNLIFGERADFSVIRNPEKKTVVEASFELDEQFKSWFENEDIDWEEITIIRREVSSQGKSRAFINDSPVQLTQLRELAEKLIYIHSQHETLEIRKTSFQFQLLDVFSHQIQLSNEVRSLYSALQKCLKEKRIVEEVIQKKIQEQDFIKFQLHEIESLDLEINDYESVEKNLSKLSKIDDTKLIFETLHFGLSSDNGPIDALRILKSQIDKHRNADTEIEQLSDRLINTITELTDLSKEAEHLANRMSADPETIALLSASLDEFNKICQKNRCNSQLELVQLKEALTQQLQSYSENEARLIELEKNISEILKELNQKSLTLFNNRLESIPALEQKLISLLKELKMEYSQIQFVLSKLDTLDANGGMHVQLLFSANKGLDLKPIDKTASGGELSRLMLAIQLILSENKSLPTLILDEIDTGVSGEVALRIGKMLKQMGNNIQLIAITHLPQVAASAMVHFEVVKNHHSDATLTSIVKLDVHQRIESIAKLISGDNLSDSALTSAAELLNG